MVTISCRKLILKLFFYFYHFLSLYFEEKKCDFKFGLKGYTVTAGQETTYPDLLVK